MKVVGLVSDVCPMRGCWVEIIEQQTSERIRVKVQDNVVIFPVEAVGQEIIAEGILRRYEMSKDQAARWLAHLAEEKNEVFDPFDCFWPHEFLSDRGAWSENSALSQLLLRFFTSPEFHDENCEYVR